MADKKSKTVAKDVKDVKAVKTTEKEVKIETPELIEKAPVETQAVESEETEEHHEVRVTKAGKRSAKSIKETEELEAKEARKAAGDTTPQSEEAIAAATRGPAPKPRSRLERRGKAYKKVAEQVEKDKAYSLSEALVLAQKTSTTKFDATVELHVNLNVDPRQADQNIRSTVLLPNGNGKKIRVAVFAPSAMVAAAKKAGADVAGEEEIIALLDKNTFDFDILISTPQLMPKLGKYARQLGPRGLMPNPKSGTVTTNVAKAVEESKAGKVEFRVDKQGIVHQGIGKTSFEAEKLLENAKAFIANLNSVRPASIKGGYIKGLSASSTMGPGIKIDTSSL
ncbi:MAG TPA: 50S ribosomal protein L1 [Patescibacteria group bacterium]|jgi:large subunit ribosomal protein L1|nr:50S ribosomal protein L1 [Patescibacteria group bacterium]